MKVNVAPTPGGKRAGELVGQVLAIRKMARNRGWARRRRAVVAASCLLAAAGLSMFAAALFVAGSPPNSPTQVIADLVSGVMGQGTQP